jgi:integrase
MFIERGNISGECTFLEAFPKWLDTRSKISDGTRKDYERYSKHIGAWLGECKLQHIHIGILIEWQKIRQAGDESLGLQAAGAIVINKEIGTVLQVRRRARINDDLEEIYEPLPLPHWKPPRTISDDDEDRFLMELRSEAKWEVAYCYALIEFRTGVVGKELRGLRRTDIDTLNRFLYVRHKHAKNEFRPRKVPLVDDAYWAVVRLLEIAAEKGSVAPHHYVLPCRVKKNLWNPDRPATYGLIKKIWGEARKRANVPTLRPHDPRHQVNTKLFETGCDDMTAREIMGHESRQMSIHYSSIRDERKWQAMNRALSPRNLTARSPQPITPFRQKNNF